MERELLEDRQLPLTGAVNLRDFGGYDTVEGRRVRRGRLLRSGTLTHLSEAAQRELVDQGLRLVCDFRRQDEKALEPTPFTGERPQILEIPIDPGSALAWRQRLDNRELSLQERIDFMVSINRELARDHAEDYARMFSALLDLEDGAFLVHCSAGKDRTGFGCALILHALGVPEDTVLMDYLLTNYAIDYEGYVLPLARRRYEVEPLPDRESIMALAGVRPEYLRSAYQAIHDEFESVEHYIEDAIGLDAAAIDHLRQHFLE